MPPRRNSGPYSATSRPRRAKEYLKDRKFKEPLASLKTAGKSGGFFNHYLSGQIGLFRRTIPAMDSDSSAAFFDRQFQQQVRDQDIRLNPFELVKDTHDSRS